MADFRNRQTPVSELLELAARARKQAGRLAYHPAGRSLWNFADELNAQAEAAMSKTAHDGSKRLRRIVPAPHRDC